MLGFVELYSLFYKDCSGYNQYNQGFRLGTKIGSNHANLPFLPPKVKLHTIAYKGKSINYHVEK